MVYTIALAFLLLLGFGNFDGQNKSKRRSFLVVAFFLLWLMSAVRYQDGRCDFRNDCISMLRVRNESFISLFRYEAPVDMLIRKVISLVTRDPQWYFVVASLISMSITISFCSKHANLDVVYIILFYCVFSYFTFNNITRQGIAVSLMILAYCKLIENRKISFFLISLLAFFIHRAAVFGLVLFFLRNVRLSQRSIIGYFVFLSVLIAANRPITSFIMRYLYTDYIDYGYGGNAAQYYYLVYVFFAIILVFRFVAIYSENTRLLSYDVVAKESAMEIDSDMINERFNNIILHGTIIYGALILLSCINSLMFARIALFFVPCVMMCIDRVLSDDIRHDNRQWLYFTILLAIAIFTIMNSTGKLTPTPYHTIWEFPNRLM